MKSVCYFSFIALLLSIVTSCSENKVKSQSSSLKNTSIDKSYFTLDNSLFGDTLVYLHENGSYSYRFFQFLNANTFQIDKYDSNRVHVSSSVRHFENDVLVLDSSYYVYPEYISKNILNSEYLPLIEDQESYLHITGKDGILEIDKKVVSQINGVGNDFVFAGKSNPWVRFDFERTVTLTDTVGQGVRTYVGYYIFAKDIGLVDHTYKQKGDTTGVTVRRMTLQSISNRINR